MDVREPEASDAASSASEIASSNTVTARLRAGIRRNLSRARPSAPAPSSAAPDLAQTVVPVGHRPPIPVPRQVRGRVDIPLPTDTARSWWITAVITLIGTLVRFWQLGWRTDRGTPIFDEKYYAVQAAEMLRNGGVEDNQAYGVIVHPPLGKQLIAVGEWLFGYNPVGWRFASALAGAVCIALIIRAARRLTRSTLLGALAGVLLIADGVSQVMSRIALLDSIQVVFVLGAFLCLLIDRDQVRARLAAAVTAGHMTSSWAGIPLYARWGRFSAGVLLGCATAVKWSGAYWVAAFGILCVLWDISARKHYGIRQPVAAVVRRDLLPSLWSLAVIPVATYIASYWAWFASENTWGRHSAEPGGIIPASLRSLADMTFAILRTTAGIVTDPDNPHPWESKPFAWPLSARPVLFYMAGGDGATGCGAGRTDCVQRILLVGTPAIWWMSLFVLAWALWKAIGRLDWRYAAVLVGYGAGFLPWLLILDRQMYFFYVAPLAPFLILGIVLVLGDILGPADTSYEMAAQQRSETQHVTPIATGTAHVQQRKLVDNRQLRLALVCAYVALVVVNFMWLWPILMGNPITPEHLQLLTWLPSWG